MREPMDAISDRRTREVVMMSSSQVGKTELLLNAAGFFIEQDPSPILAIQPTLEMARDWSRTKLSALLRDSIPGIVAEARSRDSDNTALFKKFPGGFLAIQGSNSPAGLASRSVRVLLLDEISRYADVTIEGDPIALATKRLATFSNSKLVAVSTPTFKGCRIEQMYDAGSRGEYWVPCPHCDEMQLLKWANVKWNSEPEHDPDSAVYICENGCIIEHSSKPRMLARGEWRHEDDSQTRIRSFHISELFSPWRSWADMCRDFLNAKDSPELLQVFINTSLGESWDHEQGHEVQWDQFLERREAFNVNSAPDNILVVTAGIDVQRDRLEVSLIGYGDDYEAYVLDHRVLWGEAAQGVVWDELDELLLNPIKTTEGRQLYVQAACVDSGGHWTEHVYAWCRPRATRRVFAIKGASVSGKPIASRPTIVGRMRVPLYTIGTDTAKQWIFGRLMNTAPPAMIHFSNVLDDEYFSQLTAEKMVESKKGGAVKLVWRKTRARNEALDAFVYALAAAHILAPNFAKMSNRGQPKTETEQETVEQQLGPKRPSRFRSRRNWVTRW